MVPLSDNTWNILHIDDDEEDYLIVRSMLSEAQGRSVHLDWAASLEEGRSKLCTHTYQAVLVDYDLGGSSGLDLVRECAEQDNDIPLILLTGRGSYEVDLEAMRAGATLYLTKTEINPLLLERSIRYAIERKQFERDLRERDRKLSLALEAAQMGTWTYSFDDRRLELDPRAQRMYQARGPVEDYDYVLHNFIHPDDVPLVQQALDRAADPAGDGRYRIEHRIRRADGTYTWLNVWGLAEFTGQGGVRRAVSLSGASRDITDRKRAEERARASEESLFDFIDRTHDIFFTLDRNWRFVYINRRYAEILGRTPQEFIGKHYLELVPRYGGTIAEDSIRQALQEDHPVHYQIQGQYSPHWFDVSIYPTREGVAVFGADQTERHRAIEELNLSQARQQDLIAALALERSKLAAAIDNLPVGVGIGDALGNTLSLNRAGLDLHGFASQADMFARLSQYMDEFELRYPDGRVMPPEEWPVARALRGEYVQEYELRLYNRKTTSERTISYSVAPVRDSQGETILIVYVMQDLTERKRFEQALVDSAGRLQHSNENLEHFAQVASHDLQEPLRKIDLFSQFLGRRLEGQLPPEIGAEASDYLERIQNASSRMQSLVNGLLDLSRLGAQAGEFEPVDLNALAAGVISDLESRLQAGGQVTCEPLPSIEGDPLQLRQLLQNLVGNALKYHSPERQPQVHLSAQPSPDGEHISLLVSDKGIGFDPQQLQRLLEPFQRLDNHDQFEGHGLGLAICKRIVERHHGQLRAESTPGQGSTFIVTLPLKQPKKSPTPSP